MIHQKSQKKYLRKIHLREPFNKELLTSTTNKNLETKWILKQMVVIELFHTLIYAKT